MSSRYKVELGAAIKRRRVELGLTQKDLADLTHYKEGQTVSRWERGQNLPGDLEIVASALQWTLPEMMAGIAPPDRRTARRLGIEEVPEPFAAKSHLIEEKLDRIEEKLDRVIEQTGALTDADRDLLRQVEAVLNRLGRDVGKGQPLQRVGRHTREANG